jgi:hypothetical protein
VRQCAYCGFVYGPEISKANGEGRGAGLGRLYCSHRCARAAQSPPLVYRTKDDILAECRAALANFREHVEASHEVR